jgi:UDP-glucose 4-epimerase
MSIADERPNDEILITGGAGFVGSHLAERLLAEHHRVTVLDNFSTGNARNLAHIADHPWLRVVDGDVTDHSTVAALAGGTSTVVHLAAAVGVRLIIDQPVDTIETNIRGTESVLRAARHTGSRVLLASTSEVYGKGTSFPLTEGDDVVLGPTTKRRWAYAASKMIDEFYAFAYNIEYGVQAIPFRLFNTVGARQTGRYGMVIPNLVRQALDGEPLTVFGTGEQQRCFCDVRDVVSALTGLVHAPEVPIDVYNIGNTEETSILGLAELVKSITGSDSPVELIPYDEAYPPGFEDMQRRVPDTTKIRELLGWSPTFALADIVRSVIDHQRSVGDLAPDAVPAGPGGGG